MWLIAMFDLPTDTKQARREYTLFRRKLLESGFDQLQYSVYGRHCASDESADVHLRRVKLALPPDGEVRVMRVTDQQFQRMLVYHGKIRRPPEKAPEQISFF
jgi:CRISPR-associated protein Cas2